MEHFTAAFKNFTNFSGRATRAQYWYFFLVYMMIYVVLFGIETQMGIPFVTLVYSLLLLIPSLAYGARRLHDTGRSGWWQLLIFIPLIGVIIVLVMLAMPSKEEAQEQFPMQAA